MGTEKFEKRFEKRAIKIDLKTIAPKELYEILRKFYTEVKIDGKRTATDCECFDRN